MFPEMIWNWFGRSRRNKNSHDFSETLSPTPDGKFQNHKMRYLIPLFLALCLLPALARADQLRDGKAAYLTFALTATEPH